MKGKKRVLLVFFRKIKNKLRNNTKISQGDYGIILKINAVFQVKKLKKENVFENWAKTYRIFI